MSIMDYLFNGGGSVRSKPSRSSGPKTRQKLQPRSTNAGLQSGYNTGAEYNTGVRLAALNNSAANQIMNDYNIFNSDYNTNEQPWWFETNPEPWSFEARAPLRNWGINQLIKRKMGQEDQNLMGEHGYPLDAPIGFNFRTGLPSSEQGGGWTQFIPKPGNDMLNWQFDTKYGDFGLGIGDDQIGFNYKVGFGG